MSRIPLFLLLCAVQSASLVLAQTPAAPTFPIDSISIEGNRIHASTAILTAAGLKAGDKGNAGIFDAARDRLLASGYFDTVAYRYKPASTGGFELTLELQEVETLYPIRLDALPVTAADALAYLPTVEPLFTGQLPGTKPVLERTARQIEQLLQAKNFAGKVGARVNTLGPGRFEVDFAPERGLPAVAEISFEGSKLISATDLHNALAEVAFGQPFTEEGFRVFLENQIGPLYDKKGYLHVTFPKIVATPSTQVTGVDVKITIDEGTEYKLTRVAIAGNAASDSARILRAAKLPEMTIADFDQIRQAAVRVREAMRHQGWLDVRVNTERKLDEVKKTAEFFLVVDPGPAYTFGKLTVNGLGLDGEAAIRKMWSLKSGDAFPSDYPEYFASKVKEEGLFDNLGDAKASQDIKKGTHVVDVTVDFKGAPPKERAPRRQSGAIPGPH